MKRSIVIRINNDNFKLSNYINKSHNLGFGHNLNSYFHLKNQKLASGWFIIFSTDFVSYERLTEKLVNVADRLGLSYYLGYDMENIKNSNIKKNENNSSK